LADAARAAAERAIRSDLALALQGETDVRAAQAVQSYDVEGHDIKATAQRLGVHVSNASRARQRGLQRAKDVLAQQPRYAALAA
jgi:DNA-directed RNA polymerase specialized sigma24 family protein